MKNTKEVLRKNDKYADYVEHDQLSLLLEKISFEVSSCGRWIATGSSSIKNFIINDYEFIYVISGTVFLTKNGIEHEIKENTLILLEPNTIFSAYTNDGVTTAYYYIHFDMFPLYRIYEFFNLIGYHNAPIVLHDDNREFLHLFKGATTESVSQNIGYKTLISFIFYSIIIKLIRYQNLFNSNESGYIGKVNISETNILDEATIFISKNIERNLKVYEVTEHVAVSESYLYKIFMKLLGISPSNYIKEVKLNRSVQLLQTGDFSIKEISSILGFSSPYHFSNSFKDYMGSSPSQYIKDYNDLKSSKK